MSDIKPINEKEVESEETPISNDPEPNIHSTNFSLKPDFVLSLACLLTYVVTLKGCNGTQAYCLVNINLNLLYIATGLVAISSFLFLILLRRLSVHKNPLPVILTSFVLYTLFRYDEGTNLHAHGYYNKIGFIALIFLEVAALIVIKCFLFLHSKFKTIIYILSFALLLFIVYQCNIVINHTCKDFQKGLFGKSEPFDVKCNFVVPSKCWLDYLDDTLDMSRLFGITCVSDDHSSQIEEWNRHLSFKLQPTDSICFPDTTLFDYKTEGLQVNYQRTIFERMSRENTCEARLTFQNNKGKLNISLKRNDSLANERHTILNKGKVKNILFLYIDAVSRRHFHRKMKKTSSFLEKLGAKNEVVEFFKHQAFIYFTSQNVMPMFFGESYFKKTGSSVFKHMKEAGFVSGATQDQCCAFLYDLEKDYIDDVIFAHADHENIAFNCDPNYHSTEHPYSPYSGPYSQIKRCLYGKEASDYTLEYAEQFWREYSEERKFFKLSNIMAHEGSGELIKYFDEKLAMFLEDLEKKNVFEDTALMVYSDHGNNMFGLYQVFDLEDFDVEKTMSTAFVVLPRKHDISEEEIKNLKENGGKLTSHYDIYNTLLDLAGSQATRSDMGKSLFEKIESRDCNEFSLDLDPKWCRCKENKN